MFKALHDGEAVGAVVLHGPEGGEDVGHVLEIARPRVVQQIENGEGVDGDGADHAELGLEADAGIEVVDAGDVEGHDAHAGAFLRSLGLLEVELGRVVPRLAGERVGDAVNVVRALHVDEGYGFSREDGQLRRSEVVVRHHDRVVRLTLGTRFENGGQGQKKQGGLKAGNSEERHAVGNTILTVQL